MTKKTTKAEYSIINGFIETGVHSAMKAAARKNDRTLIREINHRLKRSIEAEKAPKRHMQAAE